MSSRRKTVGLTRRDGDPCLFARLNEFVLVEFLIDTGSFCSIVSANCLNTVGLIDLVDDQHPLYQAHLDVATRFALVGVINLTLSTLDKESVEFTLDFFVSTTGDNLLGSNFLHHCSANLTFMGAWDELSVVVPPPHQVFDYMQFKVADLQPQVDCVILGQEIRALLDSGADVNVLAARIAYTSAADSEVREAFACATKAIRTFEFVGSMMDREVCEMRVGAATIGDWEVWVGRMIVMNPDFDNQTVLGVHTLRMNNTTISYGDEGSIMFRRYPVRHRGHTLLEPYQGTYNP